jgi:hypothetical protein
VGQRDLGILRGERSQFPGLLLPARRDRVLDALKHAFAGNAIELHVTASGEERESLLDLAHDG